MNKILITALIMAVSVFSNAQVVEEELIEIEKEIKTQKTDSLDGWKTGGVFGANLTQASFTNWAAGGENSLAVNGLLSTFANYKKGSSSWDNTLNLAYGILKQGEEGVRKTDDRIDFMSKYGYKASKRWYYAGLVNFKTQFADGFNYPDDSTKISTFLAPAYALAAIGMDYKPHDNFTAFISPFTARITIVNDRTLSDAGAFGVDPADFDVLGNKIKNGKTIRAEYGGYIRIMYKKDIMENINLETRFDAFSNYTEEPTHIDINWELLLAFKVNKFISTTISTQLIYDHDVDIAVDRNNDGIVDGSGPRVQFKEILGVGLNYKF
ncbi:MAG: DUF3078 domain-containing protein [Vicingaceae bacterium]|nr:DUF3078 domain-containing protein [Vicingaceae bacterium]